MKKFLTAIVAVLAIFTLTACDISGGGTTDGDKIEITFWHAMGQEKQKVIQKMIDTFEAQYPNVKVTASSQGGYGDLQSKIQDNLRGGAGPVVAQTYPDHVVAYLTSNDAVVDLNKYANDPEVGFDAMNVNPDNFFANFWEEGKKYDDLGSLYSMPFNKSTEVLFYNKDIFKKYDWFVEVLKYSADDVYSVYNANVTDESGKLVTVGKREFKDDFVWNPTWEEIIKIGNAFKATSEYSAKEIDANDNEVDVQRYALGYDSEDNLMITLTQQLAAMDANDTYGAKGEDAFVRFNSETNKGEFTFLDKNNPYPKAAMDYYKKHADEKLFAIATTLGGDYCSDFFKNQRIIMTIGSSAGASYNDGGGFTVGVATYPQFEESVKAGEQQVIQQGTNLTLFTQRDKEVEKYGWLWILWLTNYDNAKLWSTETSYFTTRKDVYDSKEYQDFYNGIKYTDGGEKYTQWSLSQEVIKVGLSQEKWFYTNVVFNGTSKARDAGEGIVVAVVSGTSTFEQAIANAKDTLKNYITA